MIRAAMVLAIMALLSAPLAHGSRSCLDKNEAARTWPGRALAIDDDGCWTYFRRGLKPAPVDAVDDRAPKAPPVPPDGRKWSNAMAAMPEIDTVLATRWVDRWPDAIVAPPKPVSIGPPQPLMRTILLFVAVVALCVSLATVAFGGMIKHRKRETRDGYFT